MNKRVVVVSPHPDDETLGAGGTLLKLKNLGCSVYWLNMTNMTKEFGFKDKVIEKRQSEIQEVGRQFGFDDIFDLALCPAGLDQYPLKELVEKAAGVFKQIEPQIVLLPFKYDVHSDHAITFNALMNCTKGFRHPYVEKVLAYETVSETEFALPVGHPVFSPSVFSDISEYIDKKTEIFKAYSTEIGEHPFPRSKDNIRALATFRGATANCRYAEAFVCLKDVF